MTESKRPVRISKAAREFNVSWKEIVDFLTQEGFVLDNSPNAKLDEKMHSKLNEEFGKDKSVKEESSKIGIDLSEKIEEISSKEDKPEEKQVPQEEVFIRGTGVALEETPPSMQKDNKPQIEEELPPTVTAKEKNIEDIETTSTVNTVELSVSDVTDVEKEEITSDELTIEKPVSVKTKEEEKEKKDDIAKPVAKKEIIKEEVKEAETEGAQNEPKILGKIDLSKIDDSTRPIKRKKKADTKTEEATKKTPKAKSKSKETKTEGTKEESDTLSKEEVKVEPTTPDAPIDSDEGKFLKTKFEILTGPKVLDKIKLPEKRKKEVKKDKKPKPVVQKKPIENQAKRRRKRIPVDKVAPNQNRENKIGKGRRGRKPVERAEVSQEDIQKQIKETLAKLTSKGKSKGSKHRREKRQMVSDRAQQEIVKHEKDLKILRVTEFVTVSEIASMMDVAVTDIIATCMNLGLFVSINQRLDAETITIVADEFDYTVDFVSAHIQDSIEEVEEDKPEDLKPRIPIVTVMGHVDHGKTKLLDYIRSANVIAGEAGGITQHIGAYEVALDDNRKITFLDTPGHEAFTAMRARGAQVTDIAIIVIAADDSVMPQTREAINHAQAAGVPMVFAINKMDKPTANAEKVKEELSAMNILVEDWGGKFQSQEISALKGTNVNELLEKVLLEAEMLELVANPNKPAKGTVIESSLEKGKGYVANLLVQEGTIKIGDVLLAGSTFGKVKAMFNERNHIVKEAGPSQAVTLLGLDGNPQAGDHFQVTKDEKEARNIATKRKQLQREQGLRTHKHITLDEIGRRIAIGDFKELNLIIKGDVDGSVEALSDSLLKLSSEEIQINILHKSVGQIIESDVMLASASDAIIIGFQIRPSIGARKLAEKEEIDIRLYSVIYKAIEEMTEAIEGMLSPEVREDIICNVEVKEVYKITKVGTVAGCQVIDGTITRNTRVRIIRDGIVIYTGKLGSLKRFKDDVKEVKNGYECGLNIENFNDIKIGDIIEGFEEVQIMRKL